MASARGGGGGQHVVVLSLPTAREEGPLGLHVSGGGRIVSVQDGSRAAGARLDRYVGWRVRRYNNRPVDPAELAGEGGVGVGAGQSHAASRRSSSSSVAADAADDSVVVELEGPPRILEATLRRQHARESWGLSIDYTLALSGVRADTPADRVGLSAFAGWRVVACGGAPTADMDALTTQLQAHAHAVTLTIAEHIQWTALGDDGDVPTGICPAPLPSCVFGSIRDAADAVDVQLHSPGSGDVGLRCEPVGRAVGGSGGVAIAGVARDSPAERAGLRGCIGWRVVGCNFHGRPDGIAALDAALAAPHRTPREGDGTFTTLALRPPPYEEMYPQTVAVAIAKGGSVSASIGVRVGGARLVILEVSPGGLADAAGLAQFIGWRVVACNHIPVLSYEILASVLGDPVDTVLLTLQPPRGPLPMRELPGGAPIKTVDPGAETAPLPTPIRTVAPVQVFVSKPSPHTPMGLVLNDLSLTIQEVLPGSPAAQWGLVPYIGWAVQYANHMLLSSFEEFAAVGGAAGANGMVLTLYPPQAAPVPVFVRRAKAQMPFGVQARDVVDGGDDAGEGDATTATAVVIDGVDPGSAVDEAGGGYFVGWRIARIEQCTRALHPHEGVPSPLSHMTTASADDVYSAERDHAYRLAVFHLTPPAVTTTDIMPMRVVLPIPTQQGRAAITLSLLGLGLEVDPETMCVAGAVPESYAASRGLGQYTRWQVAMCNGVTVGTLGQLDNALENTATPHVTLGVYPPQPTADTAPGGAEVHVTIAPRPAGTRHHGVFIGADDAVVCAVWDGSPAEAASIAEYVGWRVTAVGSVAVAADEARGRVDAAWAEGGGVALTLTPDNPPRLSTVVISRPPGEPLGVRLGAPGLRVDSVVPGSAAHRSALAKYLGCTAVACNGVSIDSLDAMGVQLSKGDPSRVRLTLLHHPQVPGSRGRPAHTPDAGADPPDLVWATLFRNRVGDAWGLSVRASDLRIVGVQSGSPAAQVGLGAHAGSHCVVSVNRERVRSFLEYCEAVDAGRRRGDQTLRVACAPAPAPTLEIRMTPSDEAYVCGGSATAAAAVAATPNGAPPQRESIDREDEGNGGGDDEKGCAADGGDASGGSGDADAAANVPPFVDVASGRVPPPPPPLPEECDSPARAPPPPLPPSPRALSSRLHAILEGFGAVAAYRPPQVWVCPTCAAAGWASDDRFCGECGQPVHPAGEAHRPRPQPPRDHRSASTVGSGVSLPSPSSSSSGSSGGASVGGRVPAGTTHGRTPGTPDDGDSDGTGSSVGGGPDEARPPAVHVAYVTFRDVCDAEAVLAAFRGAGAAAATTASVSASPAAPPVLHPAWGLAVRYHHEPPPAGGVWEPAPAPAPPPASAPQPQYRPQDTHGAPWGGNGPRNASGSGGSGSARRRRRRQRGQSPKHADDTAPPYVHRGGGGGQRSTFRGDDDAAAAAHAHAYASYAGGGEVPPMFSPPPPQGGRGAGWGGPGAGFPSPPPPFGFTAAGMGFGFGVPPGFEFDAFAAGVGGGSGGPPFGAAPIHNTVPSDTLEVHVARSMLDSRDPQVMLNELFNAFSPYAKVVRVSPPHEDAALAGASGGVFTIFVAQVVFATPAGAARALDGARRTAPHLAARFYHGPPAGGTAGGGEPPAAATEEELREEQRSKRAAGYNQLGFFNAYAVLGVPRGASKAAILKAFKAKAREHHPDKNVGDEDAAKAMFQLVQKAKNALTDPDEAAALHQAVLRAEAMFGWARVNALFPKGETRR